MIGWQIQLEGIDPVCGGYVCLRSKRIFLDKDKAENSILETISWAVDDGKILVSVKDPLPRGKLIEVEIIA